MAKCKQCQGSFGLLELKHGICNQCKNANEPPCHRCRENFAKGELNAAGLCQPCAATAADEAEEKRQLQQRVERAREVREVDEKTLKAIILTTESDSNLNVLERIEIITAECAFGMNLFRDFFAGVRDVFGGRSKSTQTVLRDARKKGQRGQVLFRA